MAKGILAGEPLSRNDILKIAHLLEQSFEHYLDPNNPYFSEYLQSLNTLVGLGFTAALADRSLLYVYRVYCEKFLILEEEYFKDYLKVKKNIAKHCSEMVHIASLCFYTLKFPAYYQDFIAALSTILKIPGMREQKEAEDILDRLKVS